MIGFGSMLFASHRGIASLAFVMTVGIALTLLSCWTLLPAWLELRADRENSRVSS
jgi:predicted RND superfamily exporter protein